MERRKCLIDGLNRIPGVYSPIPMGAFYTVAKLPVDDADKFCAWCLEEFEYEGQTVMMAPASGFTRHRDLVRMSPYGLCLEKGRSGESFDGVIKGAGSLSGKNVINEFRAIYRQKDTFQQGGGS